MPGSKASRDAQNNRLGGRIDEKADHVGGLGRELGVIALAPGFAGNKIDMVLPYRRLIQKRQDALVCRLCRRSASWPPADDPQPIKAMFGKASPPVADNARLKSRS
jgi:hypothetical protein